MKAWKKIKERPYKAGYRKMIEKTFLFPDGKEASFDIKDEGQHVCVFGLTKDTRVIVAKQFRPGPEKILMELPGGVKDKEEEPLDAVKREFLEETGYAGEMVSVGTTYHCGYSNVIKNHFVATNCVKQAEQSLEPEEFVEVELLSLEEFKDVLHSGELTDSITAYRGLEYLNLL